MARIAPGWMAMLNSDHLSASKPISSVARIRCPVELTGRYSVRPSTTPRMMTSHRIGISCCSGAHSSGAGGEPAAFAEAAEPFAGDSLDRGRRNSEVAKALGLPGRDIVLLEHQPLIARERRARQEAEAGEAR